jgi:hypothetical protein
MLCCSSVRVSGRVGSVAQTAAAAPEHAVAGVGVDGHHVHHHQRGGWRGGTSTLPRLHPNLGQRLGQICQVKLSGRSVFLHSFADCCVKRAMTVNQPRKRGRSRKGRSIDPARPASSQSSSDLSSPNETCYSFVRRALQVYIFGCFVWFYIRDRYYYTTCSCSSIILLWFCFMYLLCVTSFTQRVYLALWTSLINILLPTVFFISRWIAKDTKRIC